MSRALLYSLILHAFALAAIALRGFNFRFEPIRQPIHVAVEIEKNVRISRRSGGHESSSQRIPLANLGLGFAFKNGIPQFSARDELRGEQDFLKEDQKFFSIYRFLYRKIDQEFSYPQEFKDVGLDGEVNSEIAFTTDGKIDWDRSSFSSSSRLLRLHVIKTLRQAFVEAIPEKFWDKIEDKKHFSIHGRFAFQITEYDSDETVAEKKFASSREMYFFRNFPHSKLQWRLGPVSGLGPLWSVNVLWFLEKVPEIFSKKEKIDPLDRWKNDPEY